MEKVVRDVSRRIELNHPLTTINLGQIVKGDKNADRIVLEILKNEKPVVLDGYTVTGVFINPLGQGVPIQGEIEGNTLTATLSDGCYHIAGLAGGFINVADATDIITVVQFTAEVLSNGSGAIYDPDKVIGSLDELMEKIAEMEIAVREAIRIAQESIESIGTEGNAQVAAIRQAGAEQVAAAKNEGAAQIAAIEQKGAATLETIPEDYAKIDADVKSLKDTKADAIPDTSAKAASHELYAQNGSLAVTLYGNTTDRGVGYNKRINLAEASIINGGKNDAGDGTVAYIVCANAFGTKISYYTIPMFEASDSVQWGELAPYQYKRHQGGDTYTGSYVIFCVPGEHTSAASIKQWLADNPEYAECFIRAQDEGDGVYYEVVEVYGEGARDYIVLPSLPDGRALMGDGTIMDTVENDVLVDDEHKCRVVRRWGADGNMLDTPEIYYTDPIILNKPDGIVGDTIVVTGIGETSVVYTHDTKHYINVFRKNVENALDNDKQFEKYVGLYPSIRKTLSYDENAIVTILDLGEDVTFDSFTVYLDLNEICPTNGGGAFLDFMKNDGTHFYRTCPAVGLATNKIYTGTLEHTVKNVVFRYLRVYMYTGGYAHFTSGTIEDIKLVGVGRDGDIFSIVETKIEEAVSGDVIPKYWKTYLDENIGAIRAKLGSAGVNTDSVMYFTDHHIGGSANYANPNNTRHIIDYIKNHTSISKVIHGGDLLNQVVGQTEEQALRWLWEWHDTYIKRGVINVIGNHEVGLYNTNGGLLPLSVVYAALGKPMERFANTHGKFYYSIDNPSQKIRYIFLDTETASISTNSDELNWFIGQINSMEDNWTAVLFGHSYYFSSMTDSAKNEAITIIGNAYNNRQSGSNSAVQWDFSAAKGTVACYICGHMHRDYSEVINGLLVIGVTTDCGNGANAENDPNERTAGTITEQALDIFTFDPANRAISTIRIGAGDDRSWTY